MADHQRENEKKVNTIFLTSQMAASFINCAKNGPARCSKVQRNRTFFCVHPMIQNLHKSTNKSTHECQQA